MKVSAAGGWYLGLWLLGLTLLLAGVNGVACQRSRPVVHSLAFGKGGGAASSSARRCCRAIASGAAAVLLHRQPNSDSAASTRWGVSARTRADLWHLARLKWTTS